jgi:hypothetical protein
VIRLDIIKEYYDNWGRLLELSYENYISFIEMTFDVWGKNTKIYDKNKNYNIDIFNAYLSGYEKAKTDFGIKVKEPSDIYF